MSELATCAVLNMQVLASTNSYKNKHIYMDNTACQMQHFVVRDVVIQLMSNIVCNDTCKRKMNVQQSFQILVAKTF